MNVLHKLQLEVEALPVVDSVDIREQALLFHNGSSGSEREQHIPARASIHYTQPSGHLGISL